MNVEIGAEAAQFPEKEYISGIFFAVWDSNHLVHNFRNMRPQHIALAFTRSPTLIVSVFGVSKFCRSFRIAVSTLIVEYRINVYLNVRFLI